MLSPIGLEAYQTLRQRAIANRCRRLIDAYEGNCTASNFAKRDFTELMAEIGCQDMTPYHCRHSYITNAIRSGVELPVLQQMVGHVDGETIKTYTHLDVSDLRNAAGKISEKLRFVTKVQHGQKSLAKPFRKVPKMRKITGKQHVFR